MTANPTQDKVLIIKDGEVEIVDKEDLGVHIHYRKIPVVQEDGSFEFVNVVSGVDVDEPPNPMDDVDFLSLEERIDRAQLQAGPPKPTKFKDRLYPLYEPKAKMGVDKEEIQKNTFVPPLKIRKKMLKHALGRKR